MRAVRNERLAPTEIPCSVARTNWAQERVAIGVEDSGTNDRDRRAAIRTAGRYARLVEKTLSILLVR